MDRTITVTGEGAASARPDVVVVGLEISETSENVTTALARVHDHLGTLGDVLRGFGVRDADLRTTGSSLNPAWDPQGGRQIGHTATHGLSVVLRDEQHLNQVLSGCAEAVGNALNINRISLEVADPTPLRAQAREAAFAAALAKAEQLAALAGATLGPAVTIAEPSAGGALPMARDMVMAGAFKESGPGFEAGENTETAALVVTFALD